MQSMSIPSKPAWSFNRPGTPTLAGILLNVALALCAAAAAGMEAVETMAATPGSASTVWSLTWNGGAQDEPVAADFLPSPGLRVVTWSGTVLAISSQGELLWTAETGLSGDAKAIRLRADGSMALLSETPNLHLTVLDSGGTLLWSAPGPVAPGPDGIHGRLQPPWWDEAGQRWLVAAGIERDFAALAFTDDGAALPVLRWAPPAPEHVKVLRATSLLPLTAGGVIMSGLVYPASSGPASPPVWWTVALDGHGAELWRQLSDGGTARDAFSGAYLLASDPIVLWANDESDCGNFSLYLWALDAATGNEIWRRTWPLLPTPSCDGFDPLDVVVDSGSIWAHGLLKQHSTGLFNAPQVLKLDPGSGVLQWSATDGHDMLRAVASPGNSGVTLLSSGFPTSGALPVVASSWDASGNACRHATLMTQMTPLAAWQLVDGDRLLVGRRFDPTTGEDLEVTRVRGLDCNDLFASGFE